MTNYAHGSITDLSASTSHYLSISCLNRNIFKNRAANILVPSPHCKVSAFNVSLSLTKDNITDQVVTYATSNQKKYIYIWQELEMSENEEGRKSMR